MRGPAVVESKTGRANFARPGRGAGAPRGVRL